MIWIAMNVQTGRKPSGLCGAALYISVLSHGLDCSKSDIVSQTVSHWHPFCNSYLMHIHFGCFFKDMMNHKSWNHLINSGTFGNDIENVSLEEMLVLRACVESHIGCVLGRSVLYNQVWEASKATSHFGSRTNLWQVVSEFYHSKKKKKSGIRANPGALPRGSHVEVWVPLVRAPSIGCGASHAGICWEDLGYIS